MTPPARFRGVPVSPGRAAGVLRVAGDDAEVSATPEEVAAAFAAVSAQRMELAGKLRAAGRADDAAIIEVSGLIAADPALTVPAAEAVRGGEAPAAAIRAAAGRQATAMEQLSNPELAERAGDIRQIAAAVVDFLRTSHADSPASAPVPGAAFILVRAEVSPAELIELADAGLAGTVSVSGGGSSHAAIIARGLGVPMISSADPAVLTVPSGVPATLDADAGELVINPGPDRDLRSYSTGNRGQTLVGVGVGVAEGPVRTDDGTEITVLCNVASVPETRRGLAAGAAGVGLLRTEIPYTRAPDWPTFAEQRAQLGPILAMLPGKTATVRLLDFSGDKIPPFLDGPGLAALLSHPTALADQLRAILQAGRDTRLDILIPMVRALDEITRVREVLTWVAADIGGPVPPLGIMVELAATAARAADFAAAVDFFSIGTNDLAGDVLGLTRDDPAAGPGLAADPRVLTLVRQVADAGRDAGIGVCVCGDAAADLSVLPLLIAAGIRTVSVAAARVSSVRSGIGGLGG
jgi:phosphoenolpyruvate-protein kinase (PTS system EI component)